MTSRRLAKVYKFEGEELTLREIQERIPILSVGTIRKHIDEGRATRRAMLSYDGHRKSRAASVANAAKIKWRLF